MTALRRAVMGRFCLHLFLVLLALTAVGVTFELLDEGEKVLRSADGNYVSLGRFALLRLPDLLAQLLPIGCLLAALLTMALMLRHSELIALWSCGLSSLTLVRALLPVAVVLGAAQLALEDRLVPLSHASLRAWGVGDFRPPTFGEDEEAVWLLSGPHIVRIPRSAGRAGVLKDISIFERTDNGALIRKLRAASAAPTESGWLLRNVDIFFADTPQPTRKAELEWQGDIDLDALPLLAKTYRDSTLRDMAHLIEHEGFGQQPVYVARTWFFHRLGGATTPLLMIALVVVLARWTGRTSAFGRLALLSLALGFAFFILDRMSLAMGETGLVPPWLAGLGVKAAMVGVLGAVTLRAEN